jgi:hypothetical protein
MHHRPSKVVACQSQKTSLLTEWRMITTEKTCFKCGAEKPLAEFYKHKRMADGHLNKCKECTKSDVHKHRHGKGRERVLTYDRERGSRMTADDLRAYRAKNPEKYAAHRAVTNAVKHGQLVRADACEGCGSDFAVEGHHDDYSKPLEVRWLCAACHKQWHSRYGSAA